MAGSIAEAYYQDDATSKVIDEFLSKDYLPNEFIEIHSKLKDIIESNKKE